MINNIQTNNRKIIIYFLCGFLILGVLLLASGCEDTANTSLEYNPKKVQAYSDKTLTNLYQVFPKPTKNSKKYQKAKDANYKRYIVNNALKHHDFQTLITICKADPTILNKAYVFACGWAIEYDHAHLKDYAKCLIYYRDKMSKTERKQLPTTLNGIIESCTNDPSREDTDDNSDDDYEDDLLWQEQMQQQIMIMQQMRNR